MRLSGLDRTARYRSKEPMPILGRLGSMLRLAVFIASLGIGLAGCELLGLPIACTEIGCESAVSFHLDIDLQTGIEYRLEACVDESCATESLNVPAGSSLGHRAGQFDVSTEDDRVLFLLPEGEFPGEHRVSLRVSGPDGVLTDHQALVEFQRNQPNGPGCPPVCWFAEVFS
jgi:hypothetical protein